MKVLQLQWTAAAAVVALAAAASAAAVKQKCFVEFERCGILKRTCCDGLSCYIEEKGSDSKEDEEDAAAAPASSTTAAPLGGGGVCMSDRSIAFHKMSLDDQVMLVQDYYTRKQTFTRDWMTPEQAENLVERYRDDNKFAELVVMLEKHFSVAVDAIIPDEL